MTSPSSPGFDAESTKGGGTFNISEQVLNHQKRIDVLEERSKHQVTKEELQKELSSLTWKIFGFVSFLVGVVYWIVSNSSK